MANHARRQIRDAVVTALTGLATTGTRVYSTRVYPLQPTDLPCLLVYTAEERAKSITMPAPRQQLRTLVLGVEAVAKATADLDDVLDGIAKEVEVAMQAQSGPLLALVRDYTLDRTTIGVSGESESQVGVARMFWSFDFLTAEGSPDAVLA